MGQHRSNADTDQIIPAHWLVGHHVVLSIVGIDRVSLGYYQGKLRQENVVNSGRTP